MVTMMTVYGISKDQICVNHQDQNWLCWASVATAIANYHKVHIPTPVSLASLFNTDQENLAEAMVNVTGKGSLNSPRSPHGALKAVCNMNNKTVCSFDSKAANGVEEQKRTSDLASALMQELNKGPMIAGLTTSDDSKWALANRPDFYTWRHAVLLYAYDDATQAAHIADPAKRVEAERYKEITLTKLITGFHYANMADLGEQARKLLQHPPATISARIYVLIAVEK